MCFNFSITESDVKTSVKDITTHAKFGLKMPEFWNSVGDKTFYDQT